MKQESKSAALAQSRFARYASVVKDINDCRISRKPCNPVLSFSSCLDAEADPQLQFIRRCWDLLRHLIDIPKDSQYLPGHLSKVYQKVHDVSSEDGIRFRSKLARGGKAWLESTYRDWVSEHVRSQRFQIGGMPSVHAEVDAILKIRFTRNGRWSLPWLDFSIGKVPFWAHLFTLVRMGQLKEAEEYIDKYSAELSHTKDKNFRLYFKAWKDAEDGRLPKSLRDKLLGEWNSSIRDYMPDSKSTPKGDLFKYALYKVIGLCELTSKTIRNSDVISSTDDYLWLQLSLLREDVLPNDGPMERYSLFDFSNRMQQYGIAHFKTLPVWFMVLLLCGEFEKAAAELVKDSYFSCDGTHFAICMGYYGVLRIPESPKALPNAGSLLSSRTITLSSGTPYISSYFHIARMITKLVKQGISTEPSEMMHYLYFLGLYGSSLDEPTGVGRQTTGTLAKDYTRYIYQIIRDILAETDNYVQLLGQFTGRGGNRLPGHIELYRTLIHLNSEQEFFERIVSPAAEDADKSGRYRDAIQLYHLGSQVNEVIHLLNRKLADSLLQHTMPSDTSNVSMNRAPVDKNLNLFDGDPVEGAENVLKFYQSRTYSASILNRKTATTCALLIQLCQFRSLIDQKREEAALNLFYQLGLVPDSTNMNEIQKRADAFQDLDEAVARVMPNMLMAVSQALYKLYVDTSEQGGAFDSGARNAHLGEIKQRSKALLLFAGLIQYRIPGDIFAKMNRLDVMMG